MIVSGEAHPAHIGGQGVDFVHAAGGLQAVVPAAEVEEFEFVGVGGVVIVGFDIYAANPVAFAFEVGDEVTADESAGAGDEDFRGHGTQFLSLKDIWDTDFRDALRTDFFGGIMGHRSAG